MYFAMSQLQPWSSRDMQRGQGKRKKGRKKSKDQAIQFVTSKSMEFLLPAPTAKNSHFCVFDGYYFSSAFWTMCKEETTFRPNLLCQASAHHLPSDWLHQALLGSHATWHSSVPRMPVFAPLPQPLALQVAWGWGWGREWKRAILLVWGNSTSQNSYFLIIFLFLLVCKFSLKIRKVQKTASQQNLQMSVLGHVCFRFVRINDINLGGWGGDLVAGTPVVQA